MIYKSYLIENDIQNLNKSLVIFYGENLGLKNDFKNKIIKLNKDSEVIRMYQEEIIKDSSKFFNEINNISLFEKKRIFLIENVNDKILEIINELDSFNISDLKFYLFSEILDKKSKLRNFLEKSQKYAVVACYPDNEIGIRKIIQEQLKEFKGLNNYIINLILENSNLDSVKLNNEIDKIKAFFKNKELDEENLGNLLNTRVNNDFNALKNAAIAGDLAKTNNLLSDTVIEEDKNVFYVNSINQTLNRLNLVCNVENKDIEKAIDQLKPPIFWKDKANFIIQAKLWNKEKLKKMLNETYKVEIAIKSNPVIKKNILLKKMIIDLCLVANA